MAGAAPQLLKHLNINKVHLSNKGRWRSLLPILILLSMLLLHSSKNYSTNTSKELSRKINKVVCTLNFCFREPVMHGVVTYEASEQKMFPRCRTNPAYMIQSQ